MTATTTSQIVRTIHQRGNIDHGVCDPATDAHIFELFDAHPHMTIVHFVEPCRRGPRRIVYERR